MIIICYILKSSGASQEVEVALHEQDAARLCDRAVVAGKENARVLTDVDPRKTQQGYNETCPQQ